jgi:transposase
MRSKLQLQFQPVRQTVVNWRGPIVAAFARRCEQRSEPHAPQAAILFDKFHILRHLGDALDKIRKAEYARVTGDKRRFIKGQKYVLLSHRANLSPEGKKSLHLLLKANKRLHKAYLLREQFDQL